MPAHSPAPTLLAAAVDSAVTAAWPGSRILRELGLELMVRGFVSLLYQESEEPRPSSKCFGTTVVAGFQEKSTAFVG